MGWSDEASTEESEPEEEEETVDESEREDNDGVDLSALAPNAMSVDEAAGLQHRWKIMSWSDPGQGKTHLGYTMPGPVCIIDTENKANDIAHKFTNKTVHIWQPNDFDEAVEHLKEALSFLSEYEAQTGEVGTIMIDSMAVMWEWSQYKYIDEWYPNTPPDEVNLDLQDWPKIKDYHNKTFRKPLEECDYHVYWTATRKDDVSAAIKNDLDHTPDKPGGESTNAYKVNSIIRLYLDSNGVPAGNLQKSGLVRFKYLGLTRPTFQKHKEIIERVEEIEAGGAESVQEVEEQFDLDYDVSFTESTTTQFIQNQ